MSSAPAIQEPASELTPYSLRELVWYFLQLGTVGFGGPIALVGYMQRDLVERRRWIALKDYKEGLALAQLAPGPLAAQLAIYLGWLDYGVLGGTLVAIAFVLPSFLMVLVLSAFYLAYGGLTWMQGAFYGIGAAVIAIIARSTYKLAKSTLGKDPLLWTLFLGAGAGLALRHLWRPCSRRKGAPTEDCGARGRSVAVAPHGPRRPRVGLDAVANRDLLR